MFAVKMCCEDSAVRSFSVDASVERCSSAPLGNIFKSKSNIWRGVKFHSQCEPHCFVIPCRVNKAFDNSSEIILNAGAMAPQTAVSKGEMIRREWEAVGHVCWTMNICLVFVLRELQRILEKTSPFSVGLTRIGAAYSGMIARGTRRNQDAGSLVKRLKILTVRTPLITLPQSLVYGYWGYARRTALSGIWKPCITVRLFRWP